MSSSRSLSVFLAVGALLLLGATNGWSAPAGAASAGGPGDQASSRSAAEEDASSGKERRCWRTTRQLGGVIGGSPAGPSHKRPERDANTCLTCHLSLSDKKLRTVAEQYQESVHRDERIGCAGCHKGNPTDPTAQAHDLSRGFIAHPRHDQIAAICGKLSLQSRFHP